jgi:hypothetical protein
MEIFLEKRMLSSTKQKVVIQKMIPWWTLSRIIQRSDKMALWYEGRRSGEASSLPQQGTMRRSWLWQNADTLAAVVTAIAALVALLYAICRSPKVAEPSGRRTPTETLCVDMLCKATGLPRI